MATGDDSLDSLLDCALEDLRKEISPAPESSAAPRSGETPASTATQGLGKGLPSLQPVKRKAKHAKPASNAATMADTLEKLAEQTRNTVQNIDAHPEADAAFMENVAKQFESLGSQELESFMGSFMQQILSKEILHEPMKEIGLRYPAWLEENKTKLSPEDHERYSRQHRLIMELCRVYESTPDEFQKIMDLMQEMQSCGQPPSEIVEELAPGLKLGEDGLPQLPPEFALPQGGLGDNGNCCIM